MHHQKRLVVTVLGLACFVSFAPLAFPQVGASEAPTVDAAETFGAKLRRLAHDGSKFTVESPSYMKAIPPWQPNEVVGYYAQRVNGGNIYTYIAPGTTAASGGPIANLGSEVTSDGSARCTYFGPNEVTTDPSVEQKKWLPSTHYSLGAQRISHKKVFACVVAGKSGNASLNGTGNAIIDGTAVWTYLGAKQANPYADVFPTVTVGFTLPKDLTKVYPSDTGTFTALNVEPVAAGRGYAVGDKIVPAGGTYTKQAAFAVTSISSGGGVTGLSVAKEGMYKVLPGTQFPTPQSSTSGAGSDCTMAIRFSNGLPDLNFRNGYLAYQIAPGFAGMDTFTPTPNGTPIRQHPAYDFYTDAPVFAIQVAGESGQCVIIDGVRYNQDWFGFVSGNHYVTFDFSKAGGRKRRLIRVESISYVDFANICVDSDSDVTKAGSQDKVTALLISDSIFAGSEYGPFQPGDTVGHDLGHILGWSNVEDFSLGGTGYCNRGTSPGTGTDVFGTRIPEALKLNPDVWVIAGSINDRVFTPEQITAAAADLFKAIRAGGSTAPIVVVGTWSINDAGSTTLNAAVEDAVLAGIDAAADPLALTFWIPVRNATPLPWITGPWDNAADPSSYNALMYVNDGDNIHPVDAGTRYFAERIANAIKADVLPLLK